MQHKGIVVGGLGAGLVITQGRQHIYLCAAERECILGTQFPQTNVQTLCLAQQRIVRGNVRIIADPKLRGMEVPQHCRQPAHVIRVRVAQGHRIEMSDAAGPQRR